MLAERVCLNYMSGVPALRFEWESLIRTAGLGRFDDDHILQAVEVEISRKRASHHAVRFLIYKYYALLVDRYVYAARRRDRGPACKLFALPVENFHK